MLWSNLVWHSALVQKRPSHRGRLCPQACCELTLSLFGDDTRSPCIQLVHQSSTNLPWLLNKPSFKQLLIALPESLIAFSSTITKSEEGEIIPVLNNWQPCQEKMKVQIKGTRKTFKLTVFSYYCLLWFHSLSWCLSPKEEMVSHFDVNCPF